MSLSGKNAVVTGASSGIGEAIVKGLAVEGANVVLAARRVDKLNSLVSLLQQQQQERSLSNRFLVVQTDVTKRDQVKALVAAAEKEFGAIDIFINNAGVMPLTLFKNLREDEWELTVDVNIKGVLNGIGAVLPSMLKNNKGDIVNISSDAGRKVFPGGGVYCGTKAAVEAITASLRMETAGTNIRVTSIQPGFTSSELGTSIKDPDTLKMGEEFMSKVKPLEAEDVARAVIYTVSQPPNVSICEILLRPTQQRF